VIRTCFACPVREDSLFSQLGPEGVAELNAIRQTNLYPKGAVLFLEGQPCCGLYIVCAGKAKLTISSARGRTLIVRISKPGEVLGLAALVSNATHDLGAETLEPTQVNYLPRDEFLRFLHKYGEVSIRVAHYLSSELHRAYRQMARVALAPSAQAKLAGLLLEWGGRETDPPPAGTRFHLDLTHSEIGELIGSSRETIARNLNQFRRQSLIEIKGTVVTLLDPSSLAALVE